MELVAVRSFPSPVRPRRESFLPTAPRRAITRNARPRPAGGVHENCKPVGIGSRKPPRSGARNCAEGRISDAEATEGCQLTCTRTLDSPHAANAVVYLP